MHGGPPDKWNSAVNISQMSGSAVLDLLNSQFADGNNTVLFSVCSDGKFLFFGKYENE